MRLARATESVRHPALARSVLAAVLCLCGAGWIGTGRAGPASPGIPDVNEVRARIARNGSGWVADDTWLRSLTPEARAHLTGFVPPPAYDETLKAHLKVLPVTKTLPSAFDWRGTGSITPVKNQADCGACWAFACVGELEAFVKIHYGKELDLSESQIMQCNSSGSGCDGGWDGAAYSVMQNPGCVLEDCMPYELGFNQNAPCNQDSFLKFARITGWHWISDDITQIKTAVMTYGPVASSVDGSVDLQMYSGGCFDGGTEYTNHKVLIVGWDDRMCDGEGAWICKNSWGTSFGIAGYFYCKYGAAGIGTGVTQLEYSPPPVAFSLSGPASPLVAGQQVAITWMTTQGSTPTVDVWFSHADRCYDEQLASGVANSGSFLWTVPNEATTTGQLVIHAHSGSLNGYAFNVTPLQIIGHRTRYVSLAGGNVAPYESPGTAARTIAAAVLACNGRDSVLVAAGDYVESVAVNATVKLFGGWNPGFTARDPVLYPTRLQGFNSAIRFRESSLDFGLLDGFTLHDGEGANYDQPAPGRHGGAVLVIGCSPTLRNCRFENNRADPAGGYGLGGAVMANGGAPRIESCTFSGNRATSGGAVALISPAGSVLHDNVFTDNAGADSTTTHLGGAVYVSGGSVSFDGDEFTRNGGVYEGGAIAALGASVTAHDVRIARGRAVQSGGGVLARGGTLALEGGSITNCQAGNGGGGGMNAESATATLRHVDFTGNTTSSLGGGIRMVSLVTGAIENCVFRTNAGVLGAGLFVNPNGPVTVRNNCIVQNQGTGLFGSGPGAAQVDYNDVWDNTGGNYGGWSAGTHDVSADPLFLDPAHGDFGLALHSRCLDRGDPGAGCNDPDGSRADIGVNGGPGAVMVAPAAVAGARILALGPGRILSWDANAESDLARYVVYRDTAAVFVPSAANAVGSVNVPATRWTDTGPVPAGAYYLVVAVDAAGHVGGYSTLLGAAATGVTEAAPRRFGIATVLPNPFNPRTAVWFDLDRQGPATLAVYDLRGRLVRTLARGDLPAGRHQAEWNGRDERGGMAAAGVYLVRLSSGERVRAVKVSLTK